MPALNGVQVWVVRDYAAYYEGTLHEELADVGRVHGVFTTKEKAEAFIVQCDQCTQPVFDRCVRIEGPFIIDTTPPEDTTHVP